MTAELNRRDFIKRAGISGAGLALSGIGSAERVLGANERVRVAAIGTGRQGQGDLEAFARQPDAELVALSDVYQPNLDKAQSALLKLTGDEKDPLKMEVVTAGLFDEFWRIPK